MWWIAADMEERRARVILLDSHHLDLVIQVWVLHAYLCILQVSTQFKSVSKNEFV